MELDPTEAMADGLHTRLTAALQARLEVARAATDGPWAASTEVRLDEVDWVVFNETDTVARFYSEQNAAHAIAVDPATEIRRVEALLRVVERHAFDEASVLNTATGKPYGPGPIWAGTEPMDYPDPQCACGDLWPCADIRDLAAGEGIEEET